MTLTNSLQALREQAQKFGPVESVTIIKNHQTNKSKGCGFVKYCYREDAMDAFVVCASMLRLANFRGLVLILFTGAEKR